MSQTYNALGQRVEDYQSDAQGSPMTLAYPVDIFGQQVVTWNQWPAQNWTGWDVYWARVAGQLLNMGGTGLAGQRPLDLLGHPR